MTEPSLEKRLRELRLPDEDAAEERSWHVVRAAYEERTPSRPRPQVRRLALALAASLALLAVALSPAGAEVVDVVRDVVGVEASNTRPALGSLPASGELLVESDGAWILREDGSKRFLGDYGDVTWSPHGLFVAATDGRQLVALDPLGEVRWGVTAPARVRDPRWSPSGFRIAYRSGDDLRVVAGDGTEDHVVARDVSATAPAWRPILDAKLQAASGAPKSEQLSYVDARGRPRLIDADTRRDLELPGVSAVANARQAGPIRAVAWAPDGESFIALSHRFLLTARADTPSGPTFAHRAPRSGSLDELAVAPQGDLVAIVQRVTGRAEIRILELDAEFRQRLAFAGPGEIGDLTWSPDGRWLLAGWQDADQWLFIRGDQPRRLVAFGDISEQFDPRGAGGSFPRAGGWIQPAR